MSVEIAGDAKAFTDDEGHAFGVRWQQENPEPILGPYVRVDSRSMGPPTGIDGISINPSIRQSEGHQSSRSEAINPSIRQSVNPINPRHPSRGCRRRAAREVGIFFSVVPACADFTLVSARVDRPEHAAVRAGAPAGRKPP